MRGALEGVAQFTPREDGGLDYAESGQLSYAGQAPMEATRAYIWREVAEGIEVLYADGSPFHVIETDKLMPDALHHCDPDMYNVSYDFTRWSQRKKQWRSVWTVLGPRKDYKMLSSYEQA